MSKRSRAARASERGRAGGEHANKHCLRWHEPVRLSTREYSVQPGALRTPQPAHRRAPVRRPPLPREYSSTLCSRRGWSAAPVRPSIPKTLIAIIGTLIAIIGTLIAIIGLPIPSARCASRHALQALGLVVLR